MVTRNYAIETLYSLINCGILADDICDDLNDIAVCINGECDGLHLWGADKDDVRALYTSYSKNVLTEEIKEKLTEVYKRLQFTPSAFEQDQVNEDVLTEWEKANEGNDSSGSN